MFERRRRRPRLGEKPVPQGAAAGRGRARVHPPATEWTRDLAELWAPAAARLGELRTGAALLGFGLVLFKVLLAGAFTGYARWLSYPLLLGFPLLFFALFAKGLRGATDLGKETTPEAMPKDRRIRLVLAGMLAVAALILAPRALSDWSAPDFVMLERIDLLTSPDGSLKAALKLPDAVTGETAAPAFRPLAWGVWAAVHALFGMTPAPYGLVSLAFHLATAAMVFFLVLFYTEGRVGALLAAGLVAFSPLALEAGPGRFALGSSMAAFFLLAAAHRFRAWQISNSPFAPWEATALVALACASHETGLLAAPVLLYLSFARDRLCYRSPQERLEGMAPAAVVTGLFLAAHGLVWLLNRRSVLDLIAGVFTADAGDVFLWRIPYDLLIRLPNVLALAPGTGAGASWALRIFWLLFGALLCGLAVRGESFRLTTGLGGVLILGAAFFAVAPPLYRLAEVDLDWSSGRYAYLALAGLALVVGGMTPPKLARPSAKDIAVLAGATLLFLPPSTIRAALTPPKLSEFHAACFDALAALRGDLESGERGVLVDPRNACAWPVRIEMAGADAQRPLDLFLRGKWMRAAGEGIASLPEPPDLASLASGEALLVDYAGGAPRVTRPEARIRRALASAERFAAGDAAPLVRTDFARGRDGWVLAETEGSAGPGGLRFRWRRMDSVTFSAPVNLPHERIHAVRLEMQLFPKSVRRLRTDLRHIGSFYWRTGDDAQDAAYGDFQRIRFAILETAEPATVTIDLTRSAAWYLTPQVAEAGLVFDGEAGEAEIRAIEFLGGPEISVESPNGEGT